MRMRWGRHGIWLISAVAVCGIAYSLKPASGCSPLDSRLVRARSDVLRLRLALDVYRSEQGNFSAIDHLSIIRSLTGDNPGKTIYLGFTSKQRSPQGHFLDPWGNAYRIDLSRPGGLRVFSPGKNKKDEPDDASSDDICSWR